MLICIQEYISKIVHLFIIPLGIYYTEWVMFYICSLFFMSYFLLALRYENKGVDGSWVCYEQLGVWCSFNTLWLDSSPHTLYFWGDGEISPNFA